MCMLDTESTPRLVVIPKSDARRGWRQCHCNLRGELYPLWRGNQRTWFKPTVRADRPPTKYGQTGLYIWARAAATVREQHEAVAEVVVRFWGRCVRQRAWFTPMWSETRGGTIWRAEHAAIEEIRLPRDIPQSLVALYRKRYPGVRVVTQRAG